MSDWKLFSKSKLAELRAELDQAFKKLKPNARIKVVLKKCVANIILNNNEIANLLLDVILLMKIDDIEIRKLALQFIAAYAHLNPKEAQNALQFLQRFREDLDPILRAHALNTMAQVALPEFVDLTLRSLSKGLADSDPYVRKSAAFLVLRAYENDPGKTTALGLIDGLNDLLYDSNHTVVSHALASLDYVTENGKGLALTVDKNHAETLLGHLSATNAWLQTYILNALIGYVPQTSEDALAVIDATLPSLQHENSAVVLNAFKVIVYCSNYVRSPEVVMPTLSKRLGSLLVLLLSKPAEIQFLVLRNVILLLLGKKSLVQFDVEMFFCRFDDPIYVKDTKLEIIYLLANELNVAVVLRELEEYATEVDVAMARKAIRAFGNLAVKLENAADQCVEVICDLISNGIPYIVQEATVVIKNVLRKYPRRFDFAIQELVKHYKLIEEPDARTAFIWIVGQYCHTIENADAIVEDFVASFKDDPLEVQYATMTAVTKYYLKLPAKGQAHVIRVLKLATEESDNPDIRDRGFFYWRLISAEDQSQTKEIVLNNNPVISADTDNIDPAILEELELNIGTLASIYLKPINMVFRLAKSMLLPYSPALQERTQPSLPASAEEPPKKDLLPVPPVPRRHRLSADSNRPLQLARENSFDSGVSSNDDTPNTSRTNSFARRLSRTASFMGRKNTKF